MDGNGQPVQTQLFASSSGQMKLQLAPENVCGYGWMGGKEDGREGGREQSKVSITQVYYTKESC